ncbi:hypothetical protein [Streptomyces sp. NPDC053560]|uniref:hypothetical protein n=1 Tax=Streptomyces sp. NPDC053560 TaxID=3365711 RepID=UPI0037CE19E5
MTDDADTPTNKATETNKATDATWAVPLLALIPVPLIGFLTDLSRTWQAVSWVLWSLAALLAVAGWVQVARHGAKGAGGWSACVVLHCVLAWQATHLLTA